MNSCSMIKPPVMSTLDHDGRPIRLCNNNTRYTVPYYSHIFSNPYLHAYSQQQPQTQDQSKSKPRRYMIIKLLLLFIFILLIVMLTRQK
jgi:hypothetical protein